MKKNLRDLFIHELKDLYSAEKQLIKAMPNVVKAASNASLKKAFESHLEETKNQQKRLEKIGELVDADLTGEKCDAMAGLIKECEGMIEMDADEDVRDAGLIACVQRIEHYEIAGYGVASHFAQMLDEDEVSKILSKTLEEEYDADEKLNDLAIEKINSKAMN